MKLTRSLLLAFILPVLLVTGAVLTTNEPLSNKVIAWAKTYKGARVVYIQSGHDHFAYENPNYQQIVRQAIQWAAGRN
jgi:type 1 glutamine amidotransferase